jgi:hypothetical protein
MPARRPDAYYEQLEIRLRALSPLVDQLGDESLTAWFREYLDVGEYGLAVEVVAEQLPPQARRAEALVAGLLAEARVMGLEAPVGCPACEAR